MLEGNAFTRAAQCIAGQAGVTYALLKAQLELLFSGEDYRRAFSGEDYGTAFSGEDYRRALETKLRTLILKRDANIPLFCNQLRLVIGELFQINDTATIEKLAINDIMSKLDSALREPLKMFQLAGTCKVEALLELAKSKIVANTLSHSDHSLSTSADATRLDRLEHMMENVSTDLST